MSGTKLSLGSMPDQMEYLKPGVFTFKVNKAEIVKSPNGNTGLQLTHSEVNGAGNLNFDNYYILDKDNNLINYPLVKLKALIIATGVDKAIGDNEFEPKDLLVFLKKALIGKTFKAEVEWKDKDDPKYVQIKGSNYYVVDEEEVTLSDTDNSNLDETLSADKALNDVTVEVEDEDGF